MSDKLTSLLSLNPRSSTLPQSLFSSQEAATLIRAGLITAATSSASHSAVNATTSAASGHYSTPTSLTAISSPSGTISAVGGSNAFHDLGGGGVGRLANSEDFQLSLPTMGSYLKLVTSARQQLVTLLVKISPKHKEAPLSMLRERWDGGMASDTAPARHASRRVRGEFDGVLPGQTKKWKHHYGLRFEWVIEECVGSGLVEVFDTGSVGLGVRMR